MQMSWWLVKLFRQGSHGLAARYGRLGGISAVDEKEIICVGRAATVVDIPPMVAGELLRVATVDQSVIVGVDRAVHIQITFAGVEHEDHIGVERFTGQRVADGSTCAVVDERREGGGRVRGGRRAGDADVTPARRSKLA